MATPRDVPSSSSVGETLPLLPRHEPTKREGKTGNPVLFRAFLCAVLVSMTFGITQVPILYAFRLMTCDAYYETHHPDFSVPDICARREIEASAARAFALLAASNTIFGLINLLVARWTIKKLGVKRALLFQFVWLAVRLLIQTIGVIKGSDTGIIIVQCSQIITVLGGPNGYVLCLNTLVADLVESRQRTGALGRLQGFMFMGLAVGFLVGGVDGDTFGMVAPFETALVLLVFCFIFVSLSLPTTPPHEEDKKTKFQPVVGLARFLGPLHVFKPQKWRLPDGRVCTQFGAMTLGIGVFLGILATGYITVLLQMYATTRFQFSTSENGGLIFVYSSLRGLFLSLVFPRVVTAGRKWVSIAADEQADEPETTVQVNIMPPTPALLEPLDLLDNEDPPNSPPHVDQDEFQFDLLYAQGSLLVDAILTGLAVFVSEGWQMYVVAILLPFSAGTGSAAKGTILQMLPDSDRVDALSGLTLVESIASLSTIGLFGMIFAALAEVGKSNLTFVCNAAVALLGFVVLLFARFPPKGSQRI